MTTEGADKAEYTSQIAQTIEASGNFVNGIKNPSTFFIIMAFAFISFTVYMNYSTIDKLSLKIDELSKSINLNRIEHIRESEAINRFLNIRTKIKKDEDQNE